MSDACYCDYDYTFEVYRQKIRTARKEHKCYECGRKILPGERYEDAFGIGDGSIHVMPTCSHCLAIRDWVVAHVPCSCWSHGNMLEAVSEDVAEFAHEAPGLAFGYLRRRAALKRACGWVRVPGGYSKTIQEKQS